MVGRASGFTSVASIAHFNWGQPEANGGPSLRFNSLLQIPNASIPVISDFVMSEAIQASMTAAVETGIYSTSQP
jgi:hypothetical protein